MNKEEVLLEMEDFLHSLSKQIGLAIENAAYEVDPDLLENPMFEEFLEDIDFELGKVEAKIQTNLEDGTYTKGREDA